MSGEVLSQNEIDALLSALSTGEMDADELKKEQTEKKVKVYDFKRALRFSKDQIRSLTRIHENFARLLTTFFSAQLRTYVQISVASADQIPYEEFIRSIPKMTILNVIEVPPLDGRILMEVNPNVAYAMMDRMMGGRGTSINKVDNLTEIETKIMSATFEKAFENLREAWNTIAEIDPILADFEVNPQFLQMVSPNETVVVISLNTTIGETSGMINICIPHVVLEPIIPKLSVHYWMQTDKKEREPEVIARLERNIHRAEVPIICELGSSELAIQDFLTLDIGDVIELTQAIDQPLTIKVGDIPKFIGQPGKVNKKLAIQILDSVKGEMRMMSDDMLSQDEIDALLRGAADENDESDSYNDAFFQTEDYLSPMEQDALGEIGNISFGSSATALSTLLNQKVDITTPAVSVILRQKLSEEFPHPYVAIQVNYTEGFFGSNLLVIQQSDAAIIADLMLGGDGTNPAELMGEIQLSAVQEAMNQMMGSAATSMSTIFRKKVDISPPAIDILDLPHGEGVERVPAEDMLARISFRLKIGSLIDSNIMQLLPLEFGKSLVNELLNPGQNQTANNPVYEEQPVAQARPANQESQLSYEKKPEVNSDGLAQTHSQTGNNGEHPAYSQPVISQTANPKSYVPAHNQVHHSGPQHFGGSHSNGVQPNVQPAAFSSFEPYHIQEPETKNLDMLLDIPLQVTVELGRTKRSVKEILELSSGSIIELDKLAGEPVDILVNNRLIAQGEVVVIDENFGVRVTDIISQSDRIKKLR